MQTRTIPHTDLTVSRACMGAMTFGAQADEAAAGRMIDLCLDRGVNFIDTANVYNSGASEEILGRILGDRRGRIVLASKLGNPTGPGDDQRGHSRRAILRAIDESLRRLRTDFLDIYYLHLPDYSTPLEETLEAMHSLVQAGKIRYLAVSNYASWQVCRMHWIADRAGYAPVRISQPMYNLIARGLEQEYLPMAKELQVSTFVYNPLAGGLLTGKQSAAAPIPGSRFDSNDLYQRRYWHDPNHAAVARLTALAREEGRSPVSLALNWILHHTPADGLILGASRPEQLDENLRALDDGPLSQSALAVCDEVWSELRGVTPKYNR